MFHREDEKRAGTLEQKQEGNALGLNVFIILKCFMC